jgi:hypothetical protein
VALTFLIGGTGNQLFQYSTSGPTDRFSCFFLNKYIRKYLKWTNHDQIIRYPMASIFVQTVSIIILLSDLILAKFFKITLFTHLDIRKFKIRPSLRCWIRLGYFQECVEKRNISDLGEQFTKSENIADIVVHIRGGDLLKLERSGTSIYGILNGEYYLRSLKKINAEVLPKDYKKLELVIVTDDVEYASSLNLNESNEYKMKIISVPLNQTISIAMSARWYISSNSTLSYWITKMRSGKNSIAPIPFQNNLDLEFPNSTIRLGVDYK